MNCQNDDTLNAMDEIGTDWEIVGESSSDETTRKVSTRLFDSGIEHLWGQGDSEIDLIRRVLEWPGGERLFVRSRDVGRLPESVTSLLAQPREQVEITAYLQERSSSDLEKLLSLEYGLPKDVLVGAQQVLRQRRHGKVSALAISWTLYLACFLAGTLLGPFGAFVLALIRLPKTRTPDGLRIPYFNTLVRSRAQSFLYWGLLVWTSFVIAAVSLHLLRTKA